MNSDKAQAAIDSVISKFSDPSSLPRILSRAILVRRDEVPCSKWSWSNQFLTALADTSDARGFKQWQESGRCVKKGSNCFHILAPNKIMKNVTVRDEDTGEMVEKKAGVVVGFRTVPVFRYEDTEGAELEYKTRVANRLQNIPLADVAQSWGLTVEGDIFSGSNLGSYSPSSAKIRLVTGENDVWYHELVHAADDRLTGLKPGQHPDQEVVAELGSAVLQTLIDGADSVPYGTVHDYIASYSSPKEVTKACMGLIERVCKAVSSILDEAEKMGTKPAEVQAAA